MIFDENNIEQILEKNFFDKLKDKKDLLHLELSLCNFENKCYSASQILTRKNLFYVAINSEINNLGT